MPCRPPGQRAAAARPRATTAGCCSSPPTTPPAARSRCATTPGPWPRGPPCSTGWPPRSSAPGSTACSAPPTCSRTSCSPGLLDDKVVIGSMNRGGLQGAVFELDDRFTAYDADTIAANGLDGGKMLTRIALDDPGTAPTLEACGNAVTALARRGLMAMVEPFMTVRRDATRVREPARPRLGHRLDPHRRRPRRDERPHLAQAARRRRDGARARRDDAALPAARR